jgi:POT family proton-dependent oligopeptide transporter
VAGTLGETLGWHWGFGAAGIGMLIGLAIYLAGGRYLPADRPRASGAGAPGSGLSRSQLIERFGLLAAVAGCVVVFRGGYEQIGNTVALWSDSGVDRAVVNHWAIPASWFQSLNPLMVFLLTPFYVSRWNRQAAQGREPSSVIKMCMGAAVVGLAYLLMAAAAAWASAHGQRTSGLWLAALLVLLTAGELLILPVGLGLFGRLAPQGLSATTIALWFLAGFFGNLLAGWLAGYWSVMSHAGFFALAAAVIFLAALLLRLLAGRARRMELSA